MPFWKGGESEAMKRDILSLFPEEIETYMGEKQLPLYHAKQIFEWLHKKKVDTFSKMTNLSAQLREDLDQDFYINRINIRKKLVSSLDNTIKYIYCLQDHHLIETVYMQYRYGSSVCISTQVGCKMGCRFCASTKAGFVRNLQPGELLSQLYQIERETGKPVRNIVLMGIGEPLENLENVLRFLKILSHPKGRNFSLRRLSLSTCGILEGIRRLADEALPITLSVSLHAPTDLLRRQLMPVANRCSIKELLSRCDEYASKTHRRITYEYALIAGVNDSCLCAEQLADLLKGRLCHVNIITINPIAETPYCPSSPKTVERFCRILQRKNIPVTVRRKLGQDIEAACGQLRKNMMERGG